MAKKRRRQQSWYIHTDGVVARKGRGGSEKMPEDNAEEKYSSIPFRWSSTHSHVCMDTRTHTTRVSTT